MRRNKNKYHTINKHNFNLKINNSVINNAKAMSTRRSHRVFNTRLATAVRTAEKEISVLHCFIIFRCRQI